MSSPKPLSRKETTLKLHRAVTYYFIDKGLSVYDEVGLRSSQQYSKLRADIVGFDSRGKITIVEVKSCWQDFASDCKWQSYLGYSNKMYFAITKELYDSKHRDCIIDQLKQHGVGLFVLNSNGHIGIVLNAKSRKVMGSVRRWLITKLAWRGGFSKATTNRGMRFSTNTDDSVMKASLLEFLSMVKADRKIYISKFPKCGYKQYLNYPTLMADKYR